MELMDGTLTALARDPAFTSESGRDELANRVFEPMIRALDYIDGAGLVHRDIKPDNIFYKRQGSGYILFKLGDFGLGNFAALAKSYVGSEMYMAPEYCETKKGRPAQASKGDVWSLLVTMMWTLDVDDFRQASNSMNSRQQIHRAIKRRADHPRIRSIRRMAEFDPEERASAADMVAVVAGPQHKASLIAPLHPACDDTFDAQDIKTRFGTVVKFSGRGLNTGSNIGDIDIGPPHRRLAEWQPDPSNQGTQPPRRPHKHPYERGPRSLRRRRCRRQKPLGFSSPTSSTQRPMPGTYRVQQSAAKAQRGLGGLQGTHRTHACKGGAAERI